MCSTPFGIIGIFTTPPETQMRPGLVLNAFRHHWNLHTASSRASRASTSSAQRLSASLESSRRREVNLDRTSRVLNAFRHHWNLHGDDTPENAHGEKVLNAFRHHWNLHTRRRRLTRCTASRCSTPFGIIGIFTISALHLLPLPHVAVLNAFRHHWNLHGVWRRYVARRRSRAQRLSASLESSPDRQILCHCVDLVLNAFRHHWNLHRVLRGERGVVRRVLNAFRHHWNLHPDARHRRRGEAHVLNAFRHHWNLHVGLGAAVGQLLIGCSTPFGIIGIFTGRRPTSTAATSRAQRLSASLESSPHATICRLPRLHVLNAFRHHWNLHRHRLRG